MQRHTHTLTHRPFGDALPYSNYQSSFLHSGARGERERKRERARWAAGEALLGLSKRVRFVLEREQRKELPLPMVVVPTLQLLQMQNVLWKGERGRRRERNERFVGVVACECLEKTKLK